MRTPDQDHSIIRWEKGTPRKLKDQISIEAPLQITLRYGKSKQRTTASLAITMRTPGEDFQLASGYLFTENLINQRKDIIQMRHLSQDEVLVELHEDVFIDLTGQNRNTYVNSSCGICGKDSLSEVKATIPYLLAPNMPLVRYHDICGWPNLLDTAQKQFKATGGTHAAALVAQNELITVHEDVGRHNALDKLMGYALENLTLPLRDAAIVVSSRASFELVQKALMGGVPILASIGASTSMAIEMAAENNMTLVGFLKSNQFNVYTHPGRITI